MSKILTSIKGGLLVSCQALEYEPLHGVDIMRKMSIAAVEGGAIGIRSNSPQDIRAIKEEGRVPVIGLYKQIYQDSPVYITPTIKEVDEIVAAGADIVAVDATQRIRPDGETLKQFMEKIRRNHPDLLVMADISTYEEAVEAERLGFNMVSTTLVGYTEYTEHIKAFDIQLLQRLVAALQIPVFAEGRIKTPQEAALCMQYGAYSVIVGSAITRPQEITKDYVRIISETVGGELVQP